MKKHLLRDTGREKSKQLEGENGEGETERGEREREKATESCLNVINEITAG